jgi:peptide/nickel transport system ATP-binding protein
MSSSHPLLQATRLAISTTSGSTLVNPISFQVNRREIVALVGESGSGKTLSSLALMGLLPAGVEQSQGEIHFDGQLIVSPGYSSVEALRGHRMATVFQEPMTSMNPVLKIGEQIAEVLVRHQNLSWKQAHRQAIALLDRVGILNPEQRAKQYIHQLSGGMRQRVMIASAISCKPALLIADEPTTALDVTIQAQILALLNRIQQETGSALLLITHDLGVVAEVADSVAVMYAGQIVEQGLVDDIFNNPQHPYTIGLMGSMPSLASRQGALSTIPGAVPLPKDMPKGCRFSTRCPFADVRCHQERPALRPLHQSSHQVACFFAPLENYFTLSAEGACA